MRKHETGGKYAHGMITRTYAPGSTIDVVIDLVANHGGRFYFEMCWRNNAQEKGETNKMYLCAIILTILVYTWTQRPMSALNGYTLRMDRNITTSLQIQALEFV